MAYGGKVLLKGAPTVTMSCLFILISATVLICAQGSSAQTYYGKRIGKLSELEHLVKGEIYAVDSRTIHIKGFSYDGTAPDAYFYAGRSGRTPSDQGIIIPDENGSKEPLAAYSSKDVTLTLPDGLTIKDIAWISIWCRAFAINFGHVMIPRGFDYPRPQKIDAIPTFEHGVSSDKIVVVDAQTFLIPNFYYDGTAPDAFFWVGKGTKPDPSGTKVPDENGSLEPLKKYSGKTIVITLPGEMTVFDFDYLGVWCRAFFANFGHVLLPKNLNVPPSLKMLGVAPQTKLNCEVLFDDLAFEVRWAVAGDSIVMQLVGKVDNGEYMAFGLSGSDTKSVMIGGDVTVAWLDQVTGRGEAVDYILDAKSQCQGSRGSCPDSKVTGSSNNVRLLNAAFINDFTMLTFQRPLRAGDSSDKSINTNKAQAVIWAIGPVNSQGDASYHRLRQTGDKSIDFGRSPTWNCPLPEKQESRTSAGSRRPSSSSGPSRPAAATPAKDPWFIPPIPCYEPEDRVYYAQIGPTGGDRGYNAITGHVGWGISWYINGLLIPEINVVRGQSYTFVVEGGSDPNSPAKYHPFYITDDPEGGYEFKTDAERSSVKVFAGVDFGRDGSASPNAFGRLCQWNQDPNQPADNFASFGAYQRSLTLDCQEGQPGILQWTPDASTPDTVYYQCFTHRFLGWKINVLDSCDQTSSPGPQTPIPSRADSDYYLYDDYLDDELTTNNDVTLGGATRYETRYPARQSYNNIQPFPIFGDNLEKEGRNPFGFESFPFDVNPNVNSISKRRKPSYEGPNRSKTSKTKESLLGAPDFHFPKLPPLKLGKSVVNATAISNFQRELPKENVRPLNDYDIDDKGNQRRTRLDKINLPGTRLGSKINDPGRRIYRKRNRGVVRSGNEDNSGSPRKEEKESASSFTRFSVGRKPVPGRRPADSSNPSETGKPVFPIKSRNPVEKRRRRPSSRAKPTASPLDLFEQTTRASLVTSYQINNLGEPLYETTTAKPKEKKRKNYQSILRGSTESPEIHRITKYRPRRPFEIRENPTNIPVNLARPFGKQSVKLGQKENFLENHKTDDGIKRIPDYSNEDIYSETNQLNFELSQNSRSRPKEQKNKVINLNKHLRPDVKRPKKEIDSNTGLPFATNEGFDPSSIIYENDFRPLPNVHPASLAFKVSSTMSHVHSKPANPHIIDSPSKQFEPYQLPPQPEREFSYVGEHDELAELLPEQPEYSYITEHEELPELFDSELNQDRLNSEKFLVSSSQEVYVEDPFNLYDVQLVRGIDRPGFKDEYHSIERTGGSIPKRPFLPAFKLRPPPPHKNSPYKRFARRMSSFDKFRYSKPQPESSPTSALDGSENVGISYETLTTLKLFPKMPPSPKIQMKPAPLLSSYKILSNSDIKHPSSTSFKASERITPASQAAKKEDTIFKTSERIRPTPDISQSKKKEETIFKVSERVAPYISQAKKKEDTSFRASERIIPDNSQSEKMDETILASERTAPHISQAKKRDGTIFKASERITPDISQMKKEKEIITLEKSESKSNRPTSKKTIPTTISKTNAFDYSKSKDQLVSTATKAAHLNILKDIWDNLSSDDITIE